MEKSEKAKDNMILELIRLVDSKYKKNPWYNLGNPYFIVFIFLIIILTAGEFYVEVYLGVVRDVVRDLELVIPVIVLLIAFLAGFEGAENRALVNGNYRKLKKDRIINGNNEPLLKALIIMKTKQAEVSLEQIYGLNRDLFTAKNLIEKLYQ